MQTRKQLLAALLPLLSLVWLAMPAQSLPAGFQIGIAAETLEGQSLGSHDEESLAGILGESYDPETDVGGVFLTEPLADGSGWTVNGWNSSWKADPFVTNNFTVVNNTGVTTVFTFSVSVPIPAFNANQIIDSNILLQINDDDNAGGASAASAGFDVYRATVNGSTVLSLLLDPYSLSCASPSDCSPPGVANGQDGDEVVSLAFGPVSATEIGIIVRFSLSSGDSASVLSRFEIVPEPASALLLGLGLGALALAGRRR